MFVGFDKVLGEAAPNTFLLSLLAVIIFSRMRLRGSIIKKLSPLAFGVYLFQLNRVIWFDLKGSTDFVTSLPLGIDLLTVIGIALLIFLSGLVTEFIRTFIFKIARINSLSEILDNLLSKLLKNICGLIVKL